MNDRYFNELNKYKPVQSVNLRKIAPEIPFARPKDEIQNVLILGAENDCVVDRECVYEIGKWFGNGIEPVILSDMAHDIMLDTRWETAAGIMREWLDGIAKEF